MDEGLCRAEAREMAESVRQTVHDYGGKLPHASVINNSLIFQFLINLNLLNLIRQDQSLTDFERAHAKLLDDINKKYLRELLDDPSGKIILKDRLVKN